MNRPARIAIAAVLLVSGISPATAKSRGAAHVHGHSPHAGISKIESRPTVADPYYRLSNQYYGYSDPLHGVFDFYAVPPFSPGYTYRHVNPRSWR